MNGRYTTEQLLRLKKSPLAQKPDRLPPIEEWMPQQDTVREPQRKQLGPRSSFGRANTEDPAALDGASRRPAIFETRHVSRGSSTVPEDIILGPPKTSFQSAVSSRTFGKALESPDRRRAGTLDEEPNAQDRQAIREMFFRDRPDREGEKSKDTKAGVLSNRRSGREDTDGWTSVRPRKSFGHEDEDKPTRHGGNRESREIKDRTTRSFDHFSRDREREAEKDSPARRNGAGRARNEVSWFRENDHQTTREREPQKEGARDREWRDKDRRHEVGRENGERVEKDPEWMATSLPEEKKEAHTAEDFQRWKERMKALTGGPVEKKPKPEESTSGVFRTVSGPAKLSTKDDNPIIMDTSNDKFFGIWGEPRQTDEQSTLEAQQPSSRKETSKAGAAKASRFTSFFTPQDEVRHKLGVQIQHEPQPLQHPAPDRDSSADQEGFQRVMQMLGATNIGSGNSTPQVNPSQQSQPPGSKMPSSQAQANGPPQDDTRHSRGFQELFLSQQAQASGGSNRDSEFLFGLMQSRPKPGQNEQRGISQPSFQNQDEGMHPYGGRQATSGAKPPSPPRGQQPLPGFFDDPSIHEMNRRHPGSAPSQPNPTPTAILQRPPPGLEQIPSGWPPSQIPPPQQRHIPPPPGLSNARGGPFPPFPPPPPGMFPQDMGHLPPGMPPPFFGMNGPPPGYPPIPYGMMPPGQQGRPQGPPFDMFAAEGTGGRGPPPGL
ncbi:MAG: hypothetical protein M1824_004475 [Vezdaea acicularis]|nr:MAG: hypothetical protein M1824_004475 [Vezdaea acicularis]